MRPCSSSEAFDFIQFLRQCGILDFHRERVYTICGIRFIKGRTVRGQPLSLSGLADARIPFKKSLKRWGFLIS